MIHNQSTHSLIDRDNFERIALQAKLQRAKFLKENAGITFVMAGSIGLVCVLVLFLIPAGSTNRQSTMEAVAQMESQATKRTMEATGQMERLTTILERAKTIGPNTAHEITQLIRQPSYDCNQVACTAELERRNYLAQSKLKALLAKKTLPDENTISGDASRQIPHLFVRLK